VLVGYQIETNSQPKVTHTSLSEKIIYVSLKEQIVWTHPTMPR